MADPRASLNGLPTETLCQIVLGLERKDLKILRLMNRRLNQVANERMFESIEVATDDGSMRQLLYIISSDFLRRQVHHVNWSVLNEPFKEKPLSQMVELDRSQLPSILARNLKNHLPETSKSNIITGAPIYNNLDLQFHLMQRCLNIEVIKFKYEDLEDAMEAFQSAGTSQTSLIKRISSPRHDGNLVIRDYFRTFSTTLFKPRTINMARSVMFLQYASGGELEHVRINSHDMEVLKARGELSNQGSETPMVTDMSGLVVLSSLTRSPQLNLQTLVLTGIQTSVSDIQRAVDNNPVLKQLDVAYVTLTDRALTNPFSQILGHLRDAYSAGRLQDAEIDFRHVTTHDCPWSPFKACKHAMRYFMDGSDDELLTYATSLAMDFLDMEGTDDDEDYDSEFGMDDDDLDHADWYYQTVGGVFDDEIGDGHEYTEYDDSEDDGFNDGLGEISMT